MLLSSEDVSQRIFKSSAPILFIDTCIFLDILRSAHRDNISSNTIASALNLIKMAESNPCKVWLLTNETVQDEWHNNINSEQEKLKKVIEEMERVRKQLVIAANIILKTEHDHGEKMTSLNLHEPIKGLSYNLLKNCLLIKIADSHKYKGMDRVLKNLAPAKRGKSEPQDCVIFETFLDVSEKVRSLGYSNKIYFLTSNSDDYGKHNSPFVAIELNKVNAKLISNLEWALNEVKGVA